MVVQLDEPGVERPTSLDQLLTFETLRRGLYAVLDRDDGALVDIDDAVVQDCKRVVHGHHAPGQHAFRTRERVDEKSLLRSDRSTRGCDGPGKGEPRARPFHGRVSGAALMQV